MKAKTLLRNMEKNDLEGVSQNNPKFNKYMQSLQNKDLIENKNENKLLNDYFQRQSDLKQVNK